MSDQPNPGLRALFAGAETDLSGEAFTESVLMGIERRQRLIAYSRISIGVLIVLVELLLTVYLESAVNVFTRILGLSFIEVQDGWLQIALAPMNSVAGLLAMTFLIVRACLKRFST